MTSYVTDGTVGPWAREKLDCLGKYLHAYTTILQKKSWCEAFIYIDVFAGSGRAPLRQYKNQNSNQNMFLDVANFVREEEQETETYIHGSPKIALDIQNPFTEYIFIEKDKRRINELEALRKAYGDQRKVSILHGDANEQLQQYLLNNTQYNWKKCRAIAFIDPFGMQVPWKTIYGLGQTKAIEIILNLPVGMAIQRLLPKSGQFSEERKLMLTDYFGSSDWEKIVYEDQTGLFGEQRIKKRDAGQQLAKWYQRRLKQAYGYSSKPRLITNTQGSHLYYLLWAGPNQTGAKIASEVLKQGKVI
jgi:three-Cys-motif partner protein